MTTIDNLISEYLETVKGARSVNTYKTYTQALRIFARVATTLDTDTYSEFLRSISDMSAPSQAVHLTAIRGLYQFHAAKDASINIAAIRQIDKFGAKKVPEPHLAFDRDAIEQVIYYCIGLTGSLVDLRDRAFVLTLADTGLRLSEACSLTRGSLDRKEARATVTGKGNKTADVRFSERSLRAITDYLSARAALDGASGKPLTSLPLFARHDKGAGKKVKPIGSVGMWYSIKRCIVQAGVDKNTVRIHDFRHYFVTTAYLASGDLRFTQELARHSDPKTTSRYAHLGGKTDEMYDEIFNRSGK